MGEAGRPLRWGAEFSMERENNRCYVWRGRELGRSGHWKEARLQYTLEGLMEWPKKAHHCPTP